MGSRDRDIEVLPYLPFFVHFSTMSSRPMALELTPLRQPEAEEVLYQDPFGYKKFEELDIARHNMILAGLLIGLNILHIGKVEFKKDTLKCKDRVCLVFALVFWFVALYLTVKKYMRLTYQLNQLKGNLEEVGETAYTRKCGNYR